MQLTLDEVAQGAIENIVISVLWTGITRLFRYWSRWINWTSPAGILLIAINVLYFGFMYFAYIRPMDFWQGLLAAAGIMLTMFGLIHINIMARIEML